MNETALLPHHAAMLAASAIDREIVAERGYQSIRVKARLRELGFASSQISVPTLLVPIWSVTGEIGLYHHRPDAARLHNGKPVKYEFPAGSSMVVDVHPRIRKAVRDPSIPLLITEGVKKCDAAISIGLCCIGLIGVWNFRGKNEYGGLTALPDWESIALKGAGDVPRLVYIAFDSDVMLKPQVHAAMKRLAAFLKQRGAQVAHIYLPHGGDGSKTGLDDYIAAGKTVQDLMGLVSAEIQQPNANTKPEIDESLNVAQKLIALTGTAELFHDERGQNYATIRLADRKETWPIRSQAFKQWLGREFNNTYGKPANAQAIEDALRVVEGTARFDGPERALGVRCVRDPQDKQAIVIDVVDKAWRAIRVTPEGWAITDSHGLFRRHATQAAFIEPARHAKPTDIEALRPFLNVRSDAVWRLLVAWMVAAWIPDIPHPVLVVHGEQGTAKSTMLRILSCLLDPSQTPLRTEPRDLDAWVQIADHSLLVTLDNISKLPQWLSDALCRAVTGDAFSKRQLYTDTDDVILAFRRVVALTGIEVVVQRADLLDRSILVGLEVIPPAKRRPETEIAAKLEGAAPLIVGALLSLLQKVLMILPAVKLSSMPRMADFARVGVAVNKALGWPDGAFMAAYQRGIDEQNEEALAACLITEPLTKVVEANHGNWSGTPTDLLDTLAMHAKPGVTNGRDWPKSPSALSRQLLRIAPNLRADGIEVAQERTSRHRAITIVSGDKGVE